MFNSEFFRRALRRLKGKSQFNYEKLKDEDIQNILESIPKHGETPKLSNNQKGKGYKIYKKAKRKRKKRAKCKQ